MDKLSDYHLTPTPHKNVESWINEARKIENIPEAMTLATYGENFPEARTVLFKGFKGEALTFYSNYSSKKARELDKNPHATLLFYFQKLGRQIKINGEIQKLSREESEKYFHSRPRGSQLASFISHQSVPVGDRKELENRFREAEERYRDQEIPCPKHWGGYALIPMRYEFFLYGEYRLNDRFLFTKSGHEWTFERLEP